MIIRVHVDCSVFSTNPARAVGRFFGNVELLGVPRSGELISFPVVVPDIGVADFSSQIAIEKVIHSPRRPDAEAMLLAMLKDVEVPDEAHAKAILKEMSKVPGIFSDYWEDQ